MMHTDVASNLTPALFKISKTRSPLGPALHIARRLKESLLLFLAHIEQPKHGENSILGASTMKKLRDREAYWGLLRNSQEDALWPF